MIYYLTRHLWISDWMIFYNKKQGTVCCCSCDVIKILMVICCVTKHYAEIQGAYTLSEDFAEPYFHKYWTEIHYVTTIWKRNVCSFIVTLNAFDVRPTRVEPPQKCYIAQIPGHTNYARSVRQPFPSNTGLRFSREMAVATVGPFQMLVYYV
jgi:hypothetical protein